MSLKGFFKDLFTHRRQLRDLRADNTMLFMRLVDTVVYVEELHNRLEEEYKRSAIHPMAMFKATASGEVEPSSASTFVRVALLPRQYCYEYLIAHPGALSLGRIEYVARKFAHEVAYMIEKQVAEALKKVAAPLDI